jgi:hypothetical protein
VSVAARVAARVAMFEYLKEKELKNKEKTLIRRETILDSLGTKARQGMTKAVIDDRKKTSAG